MEKYMNNQILDKISEIVDTIKESDKYQDYLFLYQKLEQNDTAKMLISEIKLWQKQIIRQKTKGIDVSLIEQKIDNNLKKLNKIPLYVDFVNVQAELNDTYQLVKERLDNYFNEIVN